MNYLQKISAEFIAYHGTSSRLLPKIQRQGLNRPYLANSIQLATYYAEEVEAEAGGEAVVLQVNVRNQFQLRYDGEAMDEPVMASERQRNRAWNKAAKEHPEWLNGDLITIPPEAWQYSWMGVGSVRYDGIIPPGDFQEI